MYGQFIRDMPEDRDKEKSWLWTRKCDLKIPTEALICFAQEQVIRKNYVKYHINKSVDSLSCRLCGEKGETIGHIVSECSKLAQIRRHGNVARMVHWKLYEEFSIETSEKWYLHNPKTVTENVNHKLIWDMDILCHNLIVEKKPDIVTVNKMEKTTIIIDVAIPGDNRTSVRKRRRLKSIRPWKLKKIDVIPVVLKDLGSVTKNFEEYVDKIGIKIDLHIPQKIHY